MQHRCMSWAAAPGVRDGLVGSVGWTPLIKLKGVSEETGCNILGEF